LEEAILSGISFGDRRRKSSISSHATKKKELELYHETQLKPLTHGNRFEGTYEHIKDFKKEFKRRKSGVQISVTCADLFTRGNPLVRVSPYKPVRTLKNLLGKHAHCMLHKGTKMCNDLVIGFYLRESECFLVNTMAKLGPCMSCNPSKKIPLICALH